MPRVPTLCAALTLALVLAACGRPAVPQASTPGPGTVEDAAPPAPLPPGTGYLKLRKIYDYVGDRAGTPWAGFEENGTYDYPEPIFGGWPVVIVPLDEGGEPKLQDRIGVATLEELEPSGGRYVLLNAGRYRVQERLPATQGGGVWSVTGANSSRGETTTPAGAVTSFDVEVVAGETTVARFFNVCRVGGVVQPFPAGARANVNAFDWACRPAPGSLDPFFGGVGVVTSGGARIDEFNDVAVRPDGRVVAVGQAGSEVGGFDFDVRIFNPYGTRFAFDVLFEGGANAVAAQADNKVVAAGFYRPFASDFNDLALVRFNTDGGLDSSFGSGGVVILDLGGNEVSDAANGVAIQGDGKIVVGLDGGAVVRFIPSGSLDPSFGAGGVVTYSGGGVADVAVQGDGKVVVAGSFEGGLGFQLSRFNPNGTLDPSFGSGGRVSTERDDVNTTQLTGPAGLALQPDGLILAAGGGMARSGNGRPDSALARYLP